MASQLLIAGKERVAQASSLLKSGVVQATDLIRKNPITSGAALGGSVLAASQVVRVVRRKKGRKKRKTKVSRKRKGRRTRRGWSRDRRFISRQKHEQAYIRRKKRRGKKITRPRYKIRRRKSRSGGKMVSFRTKSGKLVKFKIKRRKR